MGKNEEIQENKETEEIEEDEKIEETEEAELTEGAEQIESNEARNMLDHYLMITYTLVAISGKELLKRFY